MSLDKVSDRFVFILNDLFNQKRLNLSGFSEAVGSRPSVMSDVKERKNNRRIYADWLQELVEHYNVDAVWLLTGVGEPYRKI